MILKTISVGAATFALAIVAFAQAPPQPAPELSKLDFLVGKWRSTAKTSMPGAPSSEVTGTDSFEWQKGKYFLICNSEFTSPMGPGVELMIFGYDSHGSVYTYESFNSSGEHEIATGTLSGDTWTWKSAEGSGAPFKWRYIEKMVSPTSLKIHFEMSQDGTNWSTVMDGESTKQ